MSHTKTPGTGNKIMFVLLWIASYRCRLVLTYAISGNVVGGVGEFGDQGLGQFVLKFWVKIRRSSRGSCKLNTKMSNVH